MAVSGSQKSRLRLVVVQALVFSLFATLFVRLYYLQVVGGEGYQAQAANQSVRDIVVQPQRGLIVDDQGRPLVANRTSWVISIDRNLRRQARRAAAHRAGPPRVRGRRRDPRGVEKRLVTCGHEGSVRGTCWNGSPYQPVPVASDVEQGRRPARPRAARGLPRRGRRAAERPRLPAPLRRQPRARARLPQPDHRGRVRRRAGRRRPVAQRRLERRAGRHREAVRRVVARASRLSPGRGRLDGPGARRRQHDRGHARRHPGHLHRRQGAVGRGACAQGADEDPARHVRPGDRAQLRGRLGCRRGAGGEDRPGRGDGQPADVRPGRLGRRHQHQRARAALLREGRHAVALAAPPRASSRPARRGSPS